MVANGYYPAIQNSLEGQTTALISDSATTIPVDFCQYYIPAGWAYDDVSYNAPVLAVLGPDNSDYTYPETVKITGISVASGAGNLTVSRGIGATSTAGYARTWASGTKIAPILTAQHITQIQGGLAALSRDIVVGIKIDNSSSNPSLTYVDIDKQAITLDAADFNASKIWGSIRKCVIDPATNKITYGSNARGDGLDLTGASGDVMVEYQPFYWAAERDGDIEYQWGSPYPYAGLPIHPWFVQRGGYVSPMYLGAYGACLLDDDGTLKLVSKTGEQPITGGEMWALAYTSGSTEFTVGETLTGATSGATGDVVTYHLTSGTWSAGDAAGTVYVKQHDYATTPYQAEDINGTTAGANCCSIADAGSGLGFVIADSESMGNAKGSGWGSACWWSWHARMFLMYADLGTRDAQTALGQGVVNLASGTGYAGLENGADSSDTNIGTNGTGSGTGTDGQTPVVWRGLQDPYGNWWEFVTGWLAVNAGYQIVNRAGLASAVMPAGTFSDASEYEQSVTAPITVDGYIKGYVYADTLLLGLFTPSDTTGSSDTYACDYLYAHDSGETNIRLGGGYWITGGIAGPGCLAANNGSSGSTRTIGARLEFKPQNG
jgi:hypothetical protein